MRAYDDTMGPLVSQLEAVVPLGLTAQLREALEVRNYLAHRFWFERIHLMTSDQGMLALIDELDTKMTFIRGVDAAVEAFFESRAEALGLTPELKREALEAVLAGEDDSLPKKRLPRKQERIVRSWNAPVGDGQSALIFEGSDGELWQFCERGLGWSYLVRSPDWTENSDLQPFLPADLKTRPQCSAPWVFEIELPKAHVLAVNKSTAPNQHRWSIKKRGQ